MILSLVLGIRLNIAGTIGFGILCFAAFAFLVAIWFLLGSLFVYLGNKSEKIKDISQRVVILIFIFSICIDVFRINFILFPIAVVIYFIYRNKPFRKPLRIGLISLLVSGGSLLLSAVFCSMN